MNGRHRFPLLLITFLLAIASPLHADNCISCNKPVWKGYQMKSPGFLEPQSICSKCYKIKQHCKVCDLPTVNPTTLPDGRILCPTHAAGCVLQEREAVRLFEKAKREIFPHLNGLGKLPARNVTVHLADRKQMANMRRQLGPAPSGYDTMGLTHSRRSKQGVWTHQIFLLSGLQEGTLIAIMAHEYAHVWLNENLPDDRKVQVDTVEGFCELVAFKVMQRRNDKLEQQIITKNAYTKGQVQLLLKAQSQYQFHRVVKWMLHGTSPYITQKNLGTINHVTSATPKPSPRDTAFLKPVITSVPDQLTLKGISGNPGRYLVLINNKTMQVDETAKVRVGESVVHVRCISITKDSATLKVKGRSDPLTLRLKSGS